MLNGISHLGIVCALEADKRPVRVGLLGPCTGCIFARGQVRQHSSVVAFALQISLPAPYILPVAHLAAQANDILTLPKGYYSVCDDAGNLVGWDTRSREVCGDILVAPPVGAHRNGVESQQAFFGLVRDTLVSPVAFQIKAIWIDGVVCDKLEVELGHGSRSISDDNGSQDGVVALVLVRCIAFYT